MATAAARPARDVFDAEYDYFLEDVCSRKRARTREIDALYQSLGVVRSGRSQSPEPGSSRPKTPPSEDELGRSPPPESPSSLSQKQKKALVYGPNYDAQYESLRSSLSDNYLNTARRPQNFIANTATETRFSEHPRLERLLSLKRAAVDAAAHPPLVLSLPFDRRSQLVEEMSPFAFDSIVIDLPVEDTNDFSLHDPSATSSSMPSVVDSKSSTQPGQFPRRWSWKELLELPISRIAAPQSFIWIWVGSGSGVSAGLERGRRLLASWGYRRCEDIVWLKTNKSNADHNSEPYTSSIVTPTTEHCLMGIKGTVRRSHDAHLVHCNVDLDVMAAEPDSENPQLKPNELFELVENFCLGSRRLYIVDGRMDNTHSRTFKRRGWLTVRMDEPERAKSIDSNLDPKTRFEKDEYSALFSQGTIPPRVPCGPEIDCIRPKTPPHLAKNDNDSKDQQRNNNQNNKGNQKHNSRSSQVSRNGMTTSQSQQMQQQGMAQIGSYSNGPNNINQQNQTQQQPVNGLPISPHLKWMNSQLQRSGMSNPQSNHQNQFKNNTSNMHQQQRRKQQSNNRMNNNARIPSVGGAGGGNTGIMSGMSGMSGMQDANNMQMNPTMNSGSWGMMESGNNNSPMDLQAMQQMLDAQQAQINAAMQATQSNSNYDQMRQQHQQQGSSNYSFQQPNDVQQFMQFSQPQQQQQQFQPQNFGMNWSAQPQMYFQNNFGQKQ